MKKYLITGLSGFVSQYFLRHLDTLGERVQVIGVSRSRYEPPQAFKNIDLYVEEADLTNRLLIQDILAYYKPNYVLHLASDSSVAYSWKYPTNSFKNNTTIFLNLLESIRIIQTPCRILSVGSSEQYGIVKPEMLPLNEEAPSNPINPYAVARMSQELLSKVYVQSFGQDIIMTRSFNHIGPNQRGDFVISSFARQIIQLKHQKIQTIKAGNLDIVRDFSDVRDVVRAYHLLLERGTRGEVYNICSGIGNTLYDILHLMCKLYGVEYQFEEDRHFVRPNDNPQIIGDNHKIKAHVGWVPELSLEQSLVDILESTERQMMGRN
jgi:GDP-4-dehydro-6-deoxy-D-mannose reductase